MILNIIKKLVISVPLIIFSHIVILFNLNAFSDRDMGKNGSLYIYNSNGGVFIYYVLKDGLIDVDPVSINLSDGQMVTFTNNSDEKIIFSAQVTELNKNRVVFHFFDEDSKITSSYTRGDPDQELNLNHLFYTEALDMKLEVYIGVIPEEFTDGINVFRLDPGGKFTIASFPVAEAQGIPDISEIATKNVILGDSGYGVINKTCYRGGNENINKLLTSCKDHPDDMDIAEVFYKDPQFGTMVKEVYLLHKKYFLFTQPLSKPKALTMTANPDGSCTATPIDSDEFVQVRVHKLQDEIKWDPLQQPIEFFQHVTKVTFKPYNGDCGYYISEKENTYYPIKSGVSKDIYQSGGVKVLVKAPEELGAYPIQLKEPEYEPIPGPGIDGPSEITSPEGETPPPPPPSGDFKGPSDIKSTGNGADTTGGCNLIQYTPSKQLHDGYLLILLIYIISLSIYKSSKNINNFRSNKYR